MVTSTSRSIRVFRLDKTHELQSQLEIAVRRQLLNAVEVVVEEETIQLNGTVSSWYEKQLAQETVRANAAACRIRNALRVAAHG